MQETGDGQAIYMNMDILNQISNVPLPFNSNTATPTVYTVGQTPAEGDTYTLHYNLRNNATFSGNGYVILRNSRNGTYNFPVQNKPRNCVILTSDITARHFVDGLGTNWMEIVKPGPWSFPLNADIDNFAVDASIANYASAYKVRDLMSAHQGLVGFNGYKTENYPGNVPPPNGGYLFNAEIQLDFQLSGTYEMDPNTFFNY